MSKKEIKNLAASIHQKLLNLARTQGQPFHEVLQYYAMERFLYRLSESPHVEKFTLKGALTFKLWEMAQSRPTMDIDLLGRAPNQVEAIVQIAKEICQQECQPDGIFFDSDSVQGEVIRVDADYQGVRIRFLGKFGKARINMQLDVGFSDQDTFPTKPQIYPTILDLPPPQIRVYSQESIIAEKFEAMVKLAELNTRVKDFFDIWFLSENFDFQGGRLAKAIKNTFENRKTDLETNPVCFKKEFSDLPEKQSQWKAFISKSYLKNAPQDIEQVSSRIADFLTPISEALIEELEFEKTWRAAQGWDS